jgi:hypothetical protein
VRDAALIVKGASGVISASLAAVRITWITAFGVCLLVMLSAVIFGSNGSNSSQQLPGFAFADRGDAPQLLPESVWLDQAPAVYTKTVDFRTAAPRDKGSRRANEQAYGGSHSRGQVPDRTGSQQTGSQQGDPGGGTPPSTTRSDPPEAPSVTPPDSSQRPSVTQPDPPQAPSVDPEPSQATVEVSASQSEVSASASRESVSAQVKTPVSSTDVTVGLS